MRAAPRLAGWLQRGTSAVAAPSPPAARGGHVVLVGYGLTGRTIARILRGLGERVVALEANAQTVRQARDRGEEVIYGDATRPGLLGHAGVARARAVVVAINDTVATRQVVRALGAVAPDVPLLARTRYVADVDLLASIGADVVVADEVEATLDLLAGTLRRLGHAEGGIARFVEELRDEGYGFAREASERGPDPWLLELLEEVTTEWVELPPGAPVRSLGELEVRARTGASVLAVEREGATLPNPGAGTRLEPGQRVLLFGDARSLAHARRLLGADAAAKD
jgi:CPA2 family monovalent cation:H+ antiporter-2